MLKPFEKTRVSATLNGGIEIIMETGKMANQAHGSVWVQSGNTVVQVTAVSAPLPEDKGFFPLTCNYQEMSYAAGRIPGSYFRREIGRPSERETLVSRLIDRPIRPLFKKGFADEDIIMSLERRMKCGVGKCGHGQINHLYCCKDGPVFNYAQVKELPEAL